jgi:hypothetical protein
VHHVDLQGVPRTAEGKPAMLFECGNTVPEAMAELRSTLPGNWLLRLLHFPLALGRFMLFFKAKFACHPLADYGDTPNLYVVLDRQTPEERERTVAEALRMEREHRTYNVVFNNCEHTCNKIRSGVHSSPNVSFVLWFVFRLLLGLCGLLALRMNQDLVQLAEACYDDIWARHPAWAVAAYHFLTTLPVALQAMVSYMLLTRSVWRQHSQALIDRHECYHLLGKELGRAVVVGGFTVAAVALTPQVVSGTLARFVVCAFAYSASDVFYNLCAHAVMRLILLPACGRVWLLGARHAEQ